MSSPLNDQSLAQATRLKQAASAAGNYPQVASALASSDLSSSQVNMVGSFIKGLDTSTLVQLADRSGVNVGLSAQQQDHLAALGQTAQNIQNGQVNPTQAQKQNTDPRNWLEKSFDWVASHVGNTMQTMLNNAPMHYLFEGMNDAVKAVKYPLALLSSSFDGGQKSNDIQRAMQMEGYDPSSTKSYLAFMFNKSDSVFHDLSGIRKDYGDSLVDLAIKQHQDPAAFSQALASGQLGEIDGKAAADVANSPDFQKVAQLVDQHGISPGRDLANLVTFGHTNNAAFHLLSGALDATFDIAADPTLVGGKVLAGMKALDYAGRTVQGLQDASRFSQVTGQSFAVSKLVKAGDALTNGRLRSGIENALDSEGMKNLILSPQTAVGQQASGFIQAVNDWRALSAKGPEAAQDAAAKFADINARYSRWMPFFDEVNGRQVLSTAEQTDPAVRIDGFMTDKTGEKHAITTTKGPIETVQDFADYLGSTQGLLRMGNGVAAKAAVMLPGRVGLTARLAATRAAARVEKGLSKDAQDFIIDHSKPGKNLPNEAEESIQQRLDGATNDSRTGEAIFNELRRGTADGQGFAPIKLARARLDQTSRRFSTFMPTTRNLDLNGADAIENVRRVARMYLTKGHSDALTSAFANGNTGVRRQIFNSIIEQSFHASGLSRSEDGRAFMQQWRADQDKLDQRAYGLDGTDVIQTPAGPRHVAMVPSQISQSVKIPDFKQLSYIASKAAAAGWMGRTFGYFRSGIHSPTMDALMSAIKMGWITTPSGGFRNAADEVMGFVAQNHTADGLKGRSLYTTVKTEGKADALKAAAVSDHLAARIPANLRQAANSVNHALLGSVLGKIASFTRTGFVTDEKELEYAKRLIADEHASMLSEAVAGVHIPDEPFGNDATVGLHENGVAAEKFGLDREKARTHQFDGWKQVELDGGAGLDAWVHNLHMYFADPHSPAHVALQGILDGGDAVGAVIDHMQQPAMAHFVRDSELLNTVPNGEKQVASEAEKDLAVEDYAERLVSQVALMLRGKGRPMYSDALVDEAREWKAQGVRATAGKRADAQAAAHEDLVRQAEDAGTEADQLTESHLNLAKVHRAHATHDKAQQAVADAQAKLEHAQAQLAQAGTVDHAATDAAATEARLSRADSEVDRLDTRVDDAATRRDRAKRAGATLPETKVKLQERVKAARADLKKAQRVAAQVRADIPGTDEHVAAQAKKAERLGGKVDKHENRVAGLSEKADDASADVALAQHDHGVPVKLTRDKQTGDWVNHTGHRVSKAYDGSERHEGWDLHEPDGEWMQRYRTKGDAEAALHEHLNQRPTDEHVQTAAEDARNARNKASYLRKQVESNARRVQQNTLNADHAYAANGHVDDTDIRAYLRETGQTDRAIHDPLQGGEPVVDAKIHPELAERLIAGDIPDRSWIKNNLADYQRPAHTTKPTWAPINPQQGNAAIHLSEGWAGLLGKAFNQVVEKPVQAFSRNPMRMSAYVQARKTLEPYEQHLLEHGFTPEIAEQTVHRMAQTHADQLVIKSIDNATVQTQFEMMSRNWWAFVRAQGDWLRRWSRIVKDNPTVIRKAQIALHGGEAAGMIDKDPTSGQLTFVYPGSGYMINALTHLGQSLGLPGLAKIPVMPDLRSNLTYLNPSADNPLGYSSTPVVSVPFHLLSAMLGSHAPLLQASADQIVNGQLGAGRAWYANFMPSYVNRIYDGIFKDPNNNPADAHSQLGAAMHSAIINLAAAGRLDDPRLQYDPSYRQQFLNDLQTQTKTHMAMRALLGFFLPASPTKPTEDFANADGKWADRPSFTDHAAGLASLTDEARLVFGNMSYADASAYWAKYHPGELPYEQGYSPETQAGSRDAVASATIAATEWMQENPDFVKQFGGAKGLAVYFMPSGQPGTVGGQFNQLAYNAQLEQGMRKYLTTTDQFNGLLVKNAENFYFNTKKNYDDAIATATANGDKASAKAAADDWAQQKSIIYATNPLLAEKFVGFASNGIMNTEIVNQLNDMLSPQHIAMTTKALGPDQVSGVAQMLMALRSYSDSTDQLKGQSSAEATAARAALKNDYDQQIKQITQSLPGLADLANGAFRAP